MLVSVFSTRDADTPARHKGKKTNSDNHLRNLLSARLPDIWWKPGAKHCSSLCSQSEGGEYCGGQARAENPTKSCPRALAIFATCSWPSLCEQSELQCFASGLRRMFAQRLLLLCRYAIWLKNAQSFFYILNTLPNRKLSIHGRESCYLRPRVVLPSAASSATFGRESTTPKKVDIRVCYDAFERSAGAVESCHGAPIC